ncbi:hypothetical protein ACWERY_14325 [Streptomyces sp. NPDC004082]
MIRRTRAFRAPGGRRIRFVPHVPVRRAVRAVLPAVVGRLTAALTDPSPGSPVSCEEFLRSGRLITSSLDYDLPFIPVVTVIQPLRTGMCVPLFRSAPRVYRRERRSPKTEAVDVAPAEPGTLLPDVQ